MKHQLQHLLETFFYGLSLLRACVCVKEKELQKENNTSLTFTGEVLYHIGIISEGNVRITPGQLGFASSSTYMDLGRGKDTGFLSSLRDNTEKTQGPLKTRIQLLNVNYMLRVYTQIAIWWIMIKGK